MFEYIRRDVVCQTVVYVTEESYLLSNNELLIQLFHIKLILRNSSELVQYNGGNPLQILDIDTVRMTLTLN